MKAAAPPSHTRWGWIWVYTVGAAVAGCVVAARVHQLHPLDPDRITIGVVMAVYVTVACALAALHARRVRAVWRWARRRWVVAACLSVLSLLLGACALPTHPVGAATPSAAGAGRYGAGLIALAPNGRHFTSAAAVFVLPRLPATAAGTEVLWVGVTGPKRAPLVQAGVFVSSGGTPSAVLLRAGASSRTPGGGMISTLPFAEDYVSSQNPGEMPTPRVVVHPGDTVSVTVRQVSAGWELTVRDDTSGGSGSVWCACPTSATEAEWFVEDPVTGKHYVTYAPTPVRFLTAQVTVGVGPLTPATDYTHWYEVRDGLRGTQAPLLLSGGGGGFEVPDPTPWKLSPLSRRGFSADQPPHTALPILWPYPVVTPAQWAVMQRSVLRCMAALQPKCSAGPVVVIGPPASSTP